MKKKDFKLLLKSIEQTGKIIREKMKSIKPCSKCKVKYQSKGDKNASNSL